MLPIVAKRDPRPEAPWNSGTHSAGLEERCAKCPLYPEPRPCTACLEKVDRHFAELISRVDRRRLDRLNDASRYADR